MRRRYVRRIPCIQWPLFKKVEQIQEWLEEHPDFKLEGALAPLKDLMFDGNPVVVIVEP